MAYTMHIPGIYLVYTMNLWCVVFKEKEAFLLKNIGFNIILSSNMAWVYSGIGSRGRVGGCEGVTAGHGEGHGRSRHGRPSGHQ